MVGGLLTKTYFMAGRAVRIGENGALAAAKAPVRLAAWTRRRIASTAAMLNPFGWRGGTHARRPSRAAPAGGTAPGPQPRRAAAPAPPAPASGHAFRASPAQLDVLRRLRSEIQATDPSSRAAVARVAAELGTALKGSSDAASPLGRILRTAHEVLEEVARGQVADPAEVLGEIARALEVAEEAWHPGLAAGPPAGKASKAPSRPREEAGRRPAPRHYRAPADVTREEAAAAEFEGSREKLVFYRALDEMCRGDDPARARAVRALGGIRHALSSRAVAARLARDPSAEVRRECVTALTGLGGGESLAAVEHALSDDSAGVRLAAVRGAYRLAGPESAPSLVRLFADGNEDVRRRAVACAGWLGLRHLATAVVPLLRDESAFVRRAALDALASLGAAEAVDDMIDLLGDPEETVARKASEALEAVTGRKMAEDFPGDEHGRQLLMARWRARQEAAPWLLES